MLAALSICDIVLIDKLHLEFGKGLTVLTGETGAGKSILLDSLSLALGGRGDGRLVREGTASGSVTASFELTEAGLIAYLLREHELDDSSLILRRIQFPDGRTKSFINDRPVSAALLREFGRLLVEFHGQHDDRALLDPATHRELIDRYGGLEEEAKAVLKLWKSWHEASSAAEALKKELELAERERAYLEAVCEELDELAPAPGEEEILAAKRQAVLASGKLREDLQVAAEALSSPQFPAAKLGGVLRRLERQPQLETLVALAAALERVIIEADEARRLVEEELRKDSQESVEAIEERLFKLRAVARKHRIPLSELPALRHRFMDELSRLEICAGQVDAAEKAAAEASAKYNEAAKSLSEKRQAAANRLDRAVQRELKPLRLEKARFQTHTEIIDEQGGVCCGPSGRESMTFHVQTNAGAKPGPLVKVASGGELARFLLALKVVLAEKNTAPVLVFDEIDTGVGGATASAIGERLARLGKRAQVLAVTHSPQVASHADNHYRLYKTSRGRGENLRAETCAEWLDNDGRREEIARMLAGRQITEEARAAAGRLIGAKHEFG